MSDEVGDRSDDGMARIAVAKSDRGGKRYPVMVRDIRIGRPIDHRGIGWLQKDRGQHHGQLTAGGRDHHVELFGGLGSALPQPPFLRDKPNTHPDRNRDKQHEKHIGPAKPPQDPADQWPRRKAPQQRDAKHDKRQQQDRRDHQILNQGRYAVPPVTHQAGTSSAAIRPS